MSNYRLHCIIVLMLTWNLVLSEAKVCRWYIAARTFLWPPGTRHIAPRISMVDIFVLILSDIKLWAITLTADGWARTWALPCYNFERKKSAKISRLTLVQWIRKNYTLLSSLLYVIWSQISLLVVKYYEIFYNKELVQDWYITIKQQSFTSNCNYS